MLGLSSYFKHLTSVSPFNPCEVEMVNPRFTRRNGASSASGTVWGRGGGRGEREEGEGEGAV